MTSTIDPHAWPRWLAALETEALAYLQKDRRSFRGRALVRSAQILRARPVPTQWSDLKGILGVGEGTLERLRHYAETLPADPSAERRPNNEALGDIYGLGPQRRKELLKEGVKTFADLEEYLRQHPEAVPPSTVLFLRHRGDLLQRIPLAESRTFEATLKAALARFPRLRWALAGSYRREAPSQADWDLVSSHPDPEHGMKRLIERLQKHGLQLVPFGEGPRKWEGLVRGPSGAMRRLDIRMVPEESYAAALLYFTGSKEHNIRLRQRAKKKGWRLNEYALLDQQGKALSTPDEESIFALLETPYVAPPRR